MGHHLVARFEKKLDPTAVISYRHDDQVRNEVSEICCSTVTAYRNRQPARICVRGNLIEYLQEGFLSFTFDPR